LTAAAMRAKPAEIAAILAEAQEILESEDPE
jgi:hypothetical protein